MKVNRGNIFTKTELEKIVEKQRKEIKKQKDFNKGGKNKLKWKRKEYA